MLLEQWPTTWQGFLQLVEQNGYKRPKNVCLNDSHPCTDSSYAPEEECQYCNTKGSNCIKYSYLPLADKVIRWCRKMTAHCSENDRWLNVAGQQLSGRYGMVIGFVNYPGFGIQQRTGSYQPAVQRVGQ